MADWLRKPLKRGEILGYFVFVAGFALLQIRGGFRDPWIEVAVVIMAIGTLTAARAGDGERASRSAP
jgi:hypothetical protein